MVTHSFLLKYIHIPKTIHSTIQPPIQPEVEKDTFEPEIQMFNMSELEKNVKMTFEAHNENFPITRPIPLYIFKKSFHLVGNTKLIASKQCHHKENFAAFFQGRKMNMLSPKQKKICKML